MPSKDPVNKQRGEDSRPYTVFFVNPETPEEVHTDTVMAHSCEDASAIATARYGIGNTLHIRGIGEEASEPDMTASHKPAEKQHYPCARFINGKFMSATFSDDRLLEKLVDLN